MKKIFLILVVSFACFAFTNNKIKSNSNDLELTPIIEPVIKQMFKGDMVAIIKIYPCEGEGGVAYVTLTVDCEGDGIVDYDYSGYMCADYAEPLFEQFIASC